MNVSRSYRRQLESFIRSRVSPKADWLEETFTWPPGLLALAHLLSPAGFQWVSVRVGEKVRVLGIRPLIEEPFFSLSDLEAKGFELHTRSFDVVVPLEAPAGQFWVAELATAETIVVYSCACVQTTAWHVIDEHTLRKKERRFNRTC